MPVCNQYEIEKITEKKKICILVVNYFFILFNMVLCAVFIEKLSPLLLYISGNAICND